jgi:hypothetical protein
MTMFSDSQIIEKIRETADRVFDGLGIPKFKRSEVEPDEKELNSDDHFIGGTKTMVYGSRGAWGLYRVDVGHDRWLDIQVAVRGLSGGKMNAEVDGLALWAFDDFAEFCKELQKRLVNRKSRPNTR